MDPRLTQIAADEGIDIMYRPLLPARGLLGLYVRSPAGATIVLDVTLPAQPRLERCILAEEIGHHMTVPTSSVWIAHTSATLRTVHRRDESRALRWACDLLMPIPSFIEAVRKGVTSVEDLADHFDVTPWMVHARIRTLRVPFCERFCRKRCPHCPIAA